MADEIPFENSQISNSEGLMTLTLDWDVILHTTVHHSSTSAYMPNFIEIEKTSCGRTHARTYARNQRVDLMNHFHQSAAYSTSHTYMQLYLYLIYTVSQKNDTALACRNFDVHQLIFTIFGTNVTERAGNQIMIYFSTSSK